MNGLAKISMYVLRAETKKEVLSFTIGPSNVNLEEINPMEPSPWNFFMFPSFILISITEESLPPYLAGNPPLMSFVDCMASALKTEKKPNR